ncbi:MAG: transporter substrate-binding domain-containing protein [Fibrobacterales bacterium]
MLKKIIVIIVVMIGCAIGRPVVRLAIQYDYPPYLTESDKRGGLYTEIVTAAYKSVGYSVKLNFVPWARALHGTKVGSYDAILGVYKTKERESYLLYSTPIDTLRVLFYKRKTDGFMYRGLESLSGLHIGVGRGYANSPEFDSATSFKRVEDVSNKENFIRLIKGRVDLVVETERVANSILINVDKSHHIQAVKNPLQRHLSYVGISKKSVRARELLEAFNRGLKTIKRQGLYKNIFKNYGINMP